MDELIAAIKLVLSNITAYHAQLAACQLDIQKVLNEKIQHKDSTSDDIIISIADLMNLDIDPDLLAFKKAAKTFMARHYAIQNLSERTMDQLESILNAAIVEYTEDMRARFNISAVNEYGLRVNERSGPLLTHIEESHQKYQDIIKQLDNKLCAERPGSMSTIQGYNDYSRWLIQAKCLINANNEKIEYALTLLKQHGNIMQEGMKKPDITQKESGFINTFKRLVKYAEPDEKELFGLLEQCRHAVLAISKKFPPKLSLSEINFISMDGLLDCYQELMDSVVSCSDKLVDVSTQKNSFQFLFHKKFMDALKKEKIFNAGREEVNAFYDKHYKLYNEAYDNTYAAIQLMGNAATSKKVNEKLLAVTIPEMEKIIADRVKVRKREDSHNRERKSFEVQQYGEVNGEVFKKIKEKYLCTGNSRQIIQLLLKHAEGHVTKGGLIKSFLVSMENTKNLNDLIHIMGLAIGFAELVECKTELGKRFRIMSTTGCLVNKLNAELKKLIKEEKEGFAIFNSVKAAIEDEKNSIFHASEQGRFDVIYKDFVETIEKNHSGDSYIAGLKEEFISISLWTAKNESKVSRVSLVIERIKDSMREQARKKHTELAPGYMAIDQFAVKHANAFKDIHYVQNEFPFTYRYQMLKNKLSTIKTFREQTLKELWQSLDGIAGTDRSESEKMDRMREVLNAFYMNIRESTNGSAGLLFSKGSRLGNALREFMLAKDGFFMREEYVPQRVGFRFF